MHGRHHLRGGLQRRRQIRGSQARAPQDRQVDREVRGAHPGAGKQAGPAPGPGPRQAGEGARGEGPGEERGLDHQVLLRRDGRGAGGGLLQPPGAHSQEAEKCEQTSVILRQEQDQQKGSAITQPPLLVSHLREGDKCDRVQSSDCQHCSEPNQPGEIPRARESGWSVAQSDKNKTISN